MTQCQQQNSRLGTTVISIPAFLPSSKADSVKVWFANYATWGGTSCSRSLFHLLLYLNWAHKNYFQTNTISK